jgi:predicted kinase
MSNPRYQNHNEQERELLAEIADEHDVDINLLEDLLSYEQTKVHLERRRGAKSEIQHMIEQWIEKQE